MTLKFGEKYSVKVVNVIDGDTIDVEFENGQIERVRMLGVDCPETERSRNKVNEYDSISDLDYLISWRDMAEDYAREMLSGKHVYIEFDEMAGFIGYYGRLLAYVYLEMAPTSLHLLLRTVSQECTQSRDAQRPMNTWRWNRTLKVTGQVCGATTAESRLPIFR